METDYSRRGSSIVNARMPKLEALLMVSIVAISSALASTIEDAAQSFDPSRGVILSDSEGRSVADACGGTSSSTRWPLSSIDIDRLERTLAPLLAADLRNSGSTAVVRQYYRQYAIGRIGSRRAIFVNGFHESQIASAANEASWRRSAVTVSDGGDAYWCAIYIKETGEFVKFKGRHFDTHVWFRGLG
jgi:hypothetical protein